MHSNRTSVSREQVLNKPGREEVGLDGGPSRCYLSNFASSPDLPTPALKRHSWLF